MRATAATRFHRAHHRDGPAARDALLLPAAGRRHRRPLSPDAVLDAHGAGGRRAFPPRLRLLRAPPARRRTADLPVDRRGGSRRLLLARRQHLRGFRVALGVRGGLPPPARRRLDAAADADGAAARDLGRPRFRPQQFGPQQSQSRGLARGVQELLGESRPTGCPIARASSSSTRTAAWISSCWTAAITARRTWNRTGRARRCSAPARASGCARRCSRAARRSRSSSAAAAGPPRTDRRATPGPRSCASAMRSSISSATAASRACSACRATRISAR